MPPQLDLSGRVALITGASRGIGKSSAERLWQAGASVVVNARTLNEAAIASMKAERPGSVLAVEGGIESAEFCRAMIKRVFATYKRLDILVNNAGVMRSGVLGMTPDADVEEQIAVNLAGMIHLTQAATRLLMRSGNGSVINLTSIVGRLGTPGLVAYAASKAGVIGATLAAAKELAPSHVRVNAIAPGFIATQMTDALDDGARSRFQSQIGMGRPGTPEEVADTVLYLASDLSRYVTGQVIGVDGSYVI